MVKECLNGKCGKIGTSLSSLSAQDTLERVVALASFQVVQRDLDVEKSH
jgi:hypothetical protein